MKIAIVGAGLAGIVAARALAAAGRDVVLLEKSRGLGGRVATRRAEGAFDHGAPLLHGLPGALVAAAGAAAARWRDGVVGLPGNSALPRALADGLTVRTGAGVVALARAAGGWRLAIEGAPDEEGFGAVLLAVPRPQASALLAGTGAAFPGLEVATMRPGFAVMARFAERVPAADWLKLAPPLGLALRDAAKPGRRAAGDDWVLHADDATAAARLEEPPDAVGAAMLAAFRAATGAGEPTFATAHRWRYARTGRPLGRSHLWDADLKLGLAGDWCLGAEAGHAVASGRALAERLAGDIPTPPAVRSEARP